MLITKRPSRVFAWTEQHGAIIEIFTGPDEPKHADRYEVFFVDLKKAGEVIDAYCGRS